MIATTGCRWRFDAIGTVWTVDTSVEVSPAGRDAVIALIDRFDRDWWRFRADSLVSRLAGGGSAPAPADAPAMLDRYAELSDATGAAVHPLVGEALASRGYDTAYSLHDRGARPAPARWRDVLSWHDGTLRLAEPAVVDVGAVGKGRLADLVTAELRRHGAGAVVVDAGGDVVVAGTAQRVGLEHPYDPARVIGVWDVRDAALCASAVTRRAWGDGLHHVLDARTGEPVRTIAATWAVADAAIDADAVATALFFDGGPALAARWGVQWVRMGTDGGVEWSPGCTAEVFT